MPEPRPPVSGSSPPRPPRIKICGLTRREDAEKAAGAGADYLGAILVPDTPRCVDVDRARSLAEGLDVELVVVVADLTSREAASRARGAGAGVVQLHGTETPETARRVREAGAWSVWKAVRVRDGEQVRQALERYASAVDGLVLDGWHPRRKGGTGVRFPWEEVEALRREFPPELRFVAAGGLDPDNVEEAVRRLQPDVVDVSSGVELRPGIKDPDRVRRFVAGAHSTVAGRSGTGAEAPS